MKVMILNSGFGKRLRPLTNNIPKCLLKINKDTILEHQLKSFISSGLNDFIITTGFLESKLKKFIKKKFPKINVTYIHNPIYDSTNYIYSMWLTKEHIDEDIVLLHGDLIYEEKILQKILNQQQNSVLINKHIPLPKKDFKGLIEQERVKKIGVNIFGKNVHFLLPFYYWELKGFNRWLKEIDRFIKIGKKNCYAEDAFNEISNEVQLSPIYFDEEFGMEIDTFQDLQDAKTYFRTINSDF